MADHDINALLDRAVSAWKAMSPAAQKAMLQEQRLSWVRGEMELVKWERSMTRVSR